jgi:effector-binding domain-containing protein
VDGATSAGKVVVVYEVEVRQLEEQPTAVIRARVEEDRLGSWFAGSYGALATHLQSIDVATVGLPFARCAKDATGYDVEAGLPVAEPIAADGDIALASLPGGSAATTWHHGRFATAEPAYAAIDAWLEREGAERAGAPWEIYHGDAGSDLDETTWMTEVVQPFTD